MSRRAWTLAALCLFLAATRGAAAFGGPPDGLELSAELFAGGRAATTGTLMARLAMRKTPYSQVLAEAALALPARPAEDGGVSAWTLGPAANGADPRSFGEVRLDTLHTARADQGRLALVARLAGEGGETVFASDPLETENALSAAWADGREADLVEVASADWAPKSVRYQVSRLLDRAPDATWRYVQDGLSTFVQRRLRKELVGVGALDVVLARGQDVQVNLVVAPDPAKPSKTVVLDWYALNKRFFDLADGRRVLRLYVGRHLAALYPGAKSVLLKEIALMFFKKDQARVLAERGVERILFAPSGLPPGLLAERGLPRPLPARARELFSGRSELTVSLAPLTRPPYDAMRPVDLSAVLSPRDPARRAAQSLEAASLVRTAPRREIPALLAATAERCRTLGAPCDVLEEKGLVSQEPLWSLSCAGLAASGPGGVSRGGGEAERTLAGLGVATLFTPSGQVELVQAQDGLGVRAQGPVTLETGVAFTPDPARTYSLWLELGQEAAGLAGVEAVAYGPEGESRLDVKPGFPAVFSRLPARVEGVRVRFLADGPELGFTLRRATVQSVGAQPARVDLFEAAYLFDQVRPLTVNRQDGQTLTLSAAGEPFRPQWLRLRVSTAPWSVADQPPALEIALDGKTVRWPLPGAETDLAVYLPGLGTGRTPGDTEGAPGRTWDQRPGPVGLRLTGGAPGAGLNVAEAGLSGERLTTWPRMLEQDPLLDVSGRSYALSGLNADQARDMAGRNTWMPLGPAGLTPEDRTARFTGNPWLEVEALLLADVDGPELAALGRAAAPAGGGGRGAGTLVPLAAGAGLVGLAWLAGRKGRAARAFGRVAAGLCGWLDRDRDASGGFFAWKGWLAAGLATAAAALLAGPGAVRGALFVASLFALPLWRSLRARLAGGLGGRASALALTRTGERHFLAGFVCLATLGALTRLAGAPVFPELCGLSALWLLLAALVLHLHPPRGS